jgi:hypothetical protein
VSIKAIAIIRDQKSKEGIMKKSIMIMVALIVSCIFVGPVLARDGERGHERHERHYKRGRYYAPPPVVVAPSYVNPYYAPPPQYYPSNPYPPPGITFVIPLHIH